MMVAVLLSGALLAVLNQTLLSPALPSIMAHLSVSATTVQWLTSGYSLTEAIIIPLSAYLIGRFSTRKLFLGGLGLFACGSLLAGFAPSFGILLMGRIMQAAATGAIMPMVFTLILLVFPREKRGAAMGLVGLVISFAPAIGPVVSGVLVDSVGWRYLFMIVAALTAVIIVVAAFCLENRGNFEKANFDKLSVVLSSLGMVCLLYGLSTFSSTENVMLTVGLIIVGIVLLVLFVRRQMRLEVPLLKVDVLRTRDYRSAVIIIALLEAVLIGSGVLMPLYIQNVLGETATVSGLVMLPGAVLGAVCGLVAGRMFDRSGVRRIALTGGIALVASGFAMVFLFGPDTSVYLVSVVFAVLTMGLQMLMTPVNTWGINSLDNAVIQHGNALSNTLNQVGASFGTALIISMTALASSLIPEASAAEQQYLGSHIGFIAIAVILVMMLVGIIALVKDSRGKRRETASANTGGSASSPVSDVSGSWAGLLVSEVMNPSSPFLSSEATVGDALRLLGRTETSGFPLVDREKRVVGFISDGDIMKYLGREEATFTDGINLYRAIDDGDLHQRLASLLELNVMRLATKHVVYAEADMLLVDACKVLSERRIKKLPVVHDGKLVGALSRRNVIGVMSRLAQS